MGKWYSLTKSTVVRIYNSPLISENSKQARISYSRISLVQFVEIYLWTVLERLKKKRQTINFFLQLPAKVSVRLVKWYGHLQFFFNFKKF